MPMSGMMRQHELVERVRRYNRDVNEELLNRAYVYAMKAHGSQLRASGALFFTHPLQVAAILTDLHLDDATIVAAVLHDTIEDTPSTREEIDRLFSPEIGALVEGLTKLKRLDLVSAHAIEAENFRKLLLAVAEDIRVLLIKLADRLHNMRTLHFVPSHKQARIAQETLDIYAPLAARMGMQEMREELEDLAFRYLRSEAAQMIAQRLEQMRQKNGPIIQRIEQELLDLFSEAKIPADITGRQKQPYSVWRKMERKSISFEQLSDVYGFRIIVDKVSDCYNALGLIHQRWSCVPGRFKDYISTPKQNDYSSLHTTLVGPGRQRVELQIRTKEMHAIAEYGIAAHAMYKDSNGAGKATESRAYQWLRHIIELLDEGDTPEEFLEHTKLELFQDQVFCFTPKGQLIVLPSSATPIDFAYAVHTSVGHSAIGAKINGKVMPLLSKLQNGDEVEILRSEGPRVPPAAWEELVVTGKARAAIRRAARDAIRVQYSGLGRQIIEWAFKRADKIFSEEKLKLALPKLARKNMEDVFAAVGRGEMISGDVLKAIYPESKEERTLPRPPKNEPGWFGLKRAKSLLFKVPERQPSGGASIPIRGLKGDSPVQFAPEGGAIPGDRIVGIITLGQGIVIYPIQSPALTAYDDQPGRWLDVRWDIDASQKELFPVRIGVQVINEPGAFANIANVITDNGAQIDTLNISKPSPDFRYFTLDIEVRDVKHLNTILSQIRSKKFVAEVNRLNG